MAVHCSCYALFYRPDRDQALRDKNDGCVIGAEAGPAQQRNSHE